MPVAQILTDTSGRAIEKMAGAGRCPCLVAQGLVLMAQSCADGLAESVPGARCRGGCRQPVLLAATMTGGGLVPVVGGPGAGSVLVALCPGPWSATLAKPGRQSLEQEKKAQIPNFWLA